MLCINCAILIGDLVGSDWLLNDGKREIQLKPGKVGSAVGVGVGIAELCSAKPFVLNLKNKLLKFVRHENSLNLDEFTIKSDDKHDKSNFHFLAVLSCNRFFVIL